MKVSLNWLSDHLDIGQKSAQEISDLLTFSGIEVEKIAVTGVESPHVVIAQVSEFVPHPQADRLRLCQVDDGSGKPRQIVCGASNFKPGDKVPLALPGTVMPSGMEIKESPLRGVLSQGMMCSGTELGISTQDDGLLLLPADAPVGTPLRDYLGSDTQFTIEVTPNRPDCLSHLGVARELSVLAELPMKKGRVCGPAATPVLSSDSIVLHDAGCPYYTARTIRGVKVGPSPAWLVSKLESVGQKSINNVVDITNYLQLEMGQPLHSFDLDKLNGPVQVRNAVADETFVALDSKSHVLSAADLVIADDAGPLALAGVMGGLESGVTEGSVNILLESAYFAPSRIRHTSRRLTLVTDSSYRFERGVDPGQVLAASEVATKLILELAGGQAEEMVEVAGAVPTVTGEVTLDLERCRSLLGVDLEETYCVGLLTKLGLEPVAGNVLTFQIPSYRQDLKRPVDLVEEIARVYGIANIPSQRTGVFSLESSADTLYDAQFQFKQTLVGAGFFEAQTIKLISVPQLADCLGTNPGPLQPVALKNPLSEDHTQLRPSLVPGLLASAGRNWRQGTYGVRLFEVGTVFLKSKKPEPDEKINLAILLSGPAREATWAEADPGSADMFELRGVIQALVPGAHVKVKPTKKAGDLLLPSQILVNGKPVGLCGQVRPSQVKDREGRLPTFVAELGLELLLKSASQEVRFTELPKFPGMSRDVALGVQVDLSHAQIEDFFNAQQAKEPLLQSVTLFDVYQGDRVAAGTKSVAYRLQYRDAARTLGGPEVDAVHQRILAALTASLQVTIR